MAGGDELKVSTERPGKMLQESLERDFGTKLLKASRRVVKETTRAYNAANSHAEKISPTCIQITNQPISPALGLIAEVCGAVTGSNYDKLKIVVSLIDANEGGADTIKYTVEGYYNPTNGKLGINPDIEKPASGLFFHHIDASQLNMSASPSELKLYYSLEEGGDSDEPETEQKISFQEKGGMGDQRKIESRYILTERRFCAKDEEECSEAEETVTQFRRETVDTSHTHASSDQLKTHFVDEEITTKSPGGIHTTNFQSRDIVDERNGTRYNFAKREQNGQDWQSITQFWTDPAGQGISFNEDFERDTIKSTLTVGADWDTGTFGPASQPRLVLTGIQVQSDSSVENYAVTESTRLPGSALVLAMREKTKTDPQDHFFSNEVISANFSPTSGLQRMTRPLVSQVRGETRNSTVILNKDKLVIDYHNPATGAPKTVTIRDTGYGKQQSILGDGRLGETVKIELTYADGTNEELDISMPDLNRQLSASNGWSHASLTALPPDALEIISRFNDSEFVERLRGLFLEE